MATLDAAVVEGSPDIDFVLRPLVAPSDFRRPIKSIKTTAQRTVKMNVTMAYSPVARKRASSPSMPKYLKIVGEYCVIAFAPDSRAAGITDPSGRVYRLSTAGKLDTLLDNGMSPNGLVLSLDEKFLFVAMTRANQVWRLPLHEDGTTTKAGVFFQSFGTAGPDGLALDAEGSLFICHPSLASVFAVDKDGIPKARIVSGTEGVNLTNCCFGGPENKTIYITDSLEGNIKAVEWHCSGSVPLRQSKVSGRSEA